VSFQALSINWYSKEQNILEMGYFNPQAKGLEALTLLDPSERASASQPFT
jgi:hypothetical protein